MPNSKWPTQNKVIDIFGDFWPHNALSMHVFTFFLYKSFFVYIMICGVVFLWDF